MSVPTCRAGALMPPDLYVSSAVPRYAVRCEVVERGLETSAQVAGVEELTLAKYCIGLAVPRLEARKIEQTLGLPEDRRA